MRKVISAVEESFPISSNNTIATNHNPIGEPKMSSKFRIIRIPSTLWPNPSNEKLPEGIYNATLNYASYCYDED